MAGSAWLPARVAVHARLWTDAALLALTGPHPSDPTKARVFNGEPTKLPQAPYVIVGEAVEDPNNRMGGKTGRSLIVFVHSWSKDSDDVERDAVVDRVDELLDNYLALAVTGYTTELLNMVSLQYLVDSPVGGAWTPLRHGIARYELNLVET